MISTVPMQSTISELSAVREELASVKKEKSSIHMKMIPLQAALKKALLTKVLGIVWLTGYFIC